MNARLKEWFRARATPRNIILLITLYWVVKIVGFVIAWHRVVQAGEQGEELVMLMISTGVGGTMTLLLLYLAEKRWPRRCPHCHQPIPTNIKTW